MIHLVRRCSVLVFLALVLVACGTPSAPVPEPTPQPEPQPEPPEPAFITPRTGMAASFVIGQANFVTTSEADPEKEIAAPYGRPLIHDGVLFIPDYSLGRVLGYHLVPTTSATLC